MGAGPYEVTRGATSGDIGAIEGEYGYTWGGAGVPGYASWGGACQCCCWGGGGGCCCCIASCASKCLRRRSFSDRMGCCEEDPPAAWKGGGIPAGGVWVIGGGEKGCEGAEEPPLWRIRIESVVRDRSGVTRHPPVVCSLGLVYCVLRLVVPLQHRLLVRGRKDARCSGLPPRCRTSDGAGRCQ